MFHVPIHECYCKMVSALNRQLLWRVQTFRNITQSCGYHSDDSVTPIMRYSLMLEKGILKPDKYQFFAVNKLQDVYNNLKYYGYDQLQMGNKDHSLAEVKSPKGIYLHGGVGTGKTLLLDLFYDSIPTKHKKRVHFNAFMLSLYSEINRWNLCCEDNVDFITPTQHIANKIMQDTWLLCFDEIQLADYASCALLDGVFKHMITKGAVIVATSNRAPQDLGDVSITNDFDGETTSVEQSVSSFKSLFTENCYIHHVESERDHRTEMKKGENRFLYPKSLENDEKLDRMFANLIPPGNRISSSAVEIYGRKTRIPITADHIARLSFKELCCQPLGPADYLEVCNNYETVFIDHIPKMGIGQKNEARRLLSFIDAAYECRVKVYCTAEASVEDLFLMLPRDDGAYEPEQMHLEMIGEIAYDLQLSGMDFRSLNIISGEDEIFSFKRAISRLKEMQSIFYQSSEYRQQRFIPYIGSMEEKKAAEDRRRLREKHRQGRIIAAREEANDKDLHRSDEASYVTLSRETVQRMNQQQLPFPDRQNEAPEFGKQHFWGFGWWEYVKSKVKPNKDS